MMRTLITNGKIVTYETIIDGYVLIEDGKIIEVGPNKYIHDCDIIIDAENEYVSPGFIDIHIHGGGGSDFMDATTEAFINVARTHLKYGTTTLMPTTLTGSKEKIVEVLTAFKNFTSNPSMNTFNTSFLGMHLEGPYFAMQHRGAQDPRFIRNPNESEINDILAYEKFISRWSIAPELPGSLSLGKLLSQKNIIASIAHTDSLFNDIIAALENGYNLVTHLYSAMNGVTRKNAYRYAGTIEAAFLKDELYVEVIADGKHLPVPLLQLVYKIKGPDKIALVTDAMRAAGTNVTKSILGDFSNGIEVLIEDGVAKLPDRSSFAGSIATSNKLVKTMWKDAGIELTDVIKMMCSTPAKIAGIEHELGKIEKNMTADLVIFDKEVNIKKILKKGVLIHL